MLTLLPVFCFSIKLLGRPTILDGVDPLFRSQRCRDQISMLFWRRKDIWISQSISNGTSGSVVARAVITGTRVTLRTLLASLAEGSSFDEILKDYPSLSADQLRSVVDFAAATAKEDLPLLAAPTLV
jgi:uncharacterized protein (DUF433 family)